jgi:hypothetical protein
MAKKVTDLTIKGWLKERFEGRSCGNGLYLETFAKTAHFYR